MRLHIAVFSKTKASIDIAFAYNLDGVTVILYDNFIPLNVNAILSDYPLDVGDVPPNTRVIIGEHVHISDHIREIIQAHT